MKLKLYSFFKKEYLILYLIILLGAFLRLQGVFTNSFAFTYDVGRDMLALWDIAYNHKLLLIGATTGIPGVFYGPWWYYLLTPFFLIFSGNPQGIALVMSLIGVLSIVLGYVLGKKLGGYFLGLILAGLISVSGNLVSLSSQIWNPNIAPLFVIFVLLALVKIYKINSPKYYLLLGFLLAFNIDLEIVFGILLSIGVVISAVLILNKKLTIKSIIYFLSGYLIIFLPRIFFELRHQFIMTKSFLGFFLNGNSSHEASNILFILLNRLNVVFDQFNASLAASNKLVGLLILFFILITIVANYKKIDLQVKNFIKTAVIVLLVFLFGTIFFSHDIWPHYLVGIPVFYILLFAISLDIFYKKVSRNLALIIFSILLIININPISLINNLNKPMWEGDASVYRNQIAVIDYVYKEAQGKAFKYVTYTPPVYDYTYQYLFRWYGMSRYEYQPIKEARTAYFILEPDFQYPTRLTDWLNARREDGKIIKSEKVKGGIIVQTRVH